MSEKIVLSFNPVLFVTIDIDIICSFAAGMNRCVYSTNRHFDLLIRRNRRQETVFSKQNFPNVFGAGSG